jgi:flagellar assembly protein FliH
MKFEFDEFDLEPGQDGDFEAAPPVPDPTFTQAQLEQARGAGEAAGREAALREAAISMDAETIALLKSIDRAAAELLAERQRQGEFIFAEAVRLAVSMARRVLPAYAEANGVKEIESLILTCLKDRPEEARLVIRLPDFLLDVVSARMQALTGETSFAGKPIMLADPALQRAQARVEWANGGADWNFDLALGDMEAAARRLTASTKATKPRKAAAPAADMAQPAEETK